MSHGMSNGTRDAIPRGLPHSPSPLTNSWLKSIHDLRLLGRPADKRMAAVAAFRRGVR